MRTNTKSKTGETIATRTFTFEEMLSTEDLEYAKRHGLSPMDMWYFKTEMDQEETLQAEIAKRIALRDSHPIVD